MVLRKSPERKTYGGGKPLASAKIGLMAVLVGGVAAGTLAPQPVYAEEEWRVGGMLQIPFGGSKEKSFVHFANTRIGVKVQYAEIDDVIKRNELTVDRVFQGNVELSATVTSEGVVTVDEGDKVVGGEGYLLVAPFNGFWDVSGGINGFGGKDIIQGAAGLGYDPSFGVYLGIGALMPYSEVGIRLNFRHIDYFVGATSLPKFSSKTVWQEDKITYSDTFEAIPEEGAALDSTAVEVPAVEEVTEAPPST
jgi:hypothetical protein